MSPCRKTALRGATNATHFCSMLTLMRFKWMWLLIMFPYLCPNIPNLGAIKEEGCAGGGLQLSYGTMRVGIFTTASH